MSELPLTSHRWRRQRLSAQLCVASCSGSLSQVQMLSRGRWQVCKRRDEPAFPFSRGSRRHGSCSLRDVGQARPGAQVGAAASSGGDGSGAASRRDRAAGLCSLQRCRPGGQAAAAVCPWGRRSVAVLLGQAAGPLSTDVGRADPRALVGVGGMWELRHRFMNPGPVV